MKHFPTSFATSAEETATILTKLWLLIPEADIPYLPIYLYSPNSDQLTTDIKTLFAQEEIQICLGQLFHNLNQSKNVLQRVLDKNSAATTANQVLSNFIRQKSLWNWGKLWTAMTRKLWPLSTHSYRDEGVADAASPSAPASSLNLSLVEQTTIESESVELTPLEHQTVDGLYKRISTVLIHFPSAIRRNDQDELESFQLLLRVYPQLLVLPAVQDLDRQIIQINPTHTYYSQAILALQQQNAFKSGYMKRVLNPQSLELFQYLVDFYQKCMETTATMPGITMLPDQLPYRRQIFLEWCHVIGNAHKRLHSKDIMCLKNIYSPPHQSSLLALSADYFLDTNPGAKDNNPLLVSASIHASAWPILLELLRNPQRWIERSATMGSPGRGATNSSPLDQQHDPFDRPILAFLRRCQDIDQDSFTQIVRALLSCGVSFKTEEETPNIFVQLAIHGRAPQLIPTLLEIVQGSNSTVLAQINTSYKYSQESGCTIGHMLAYRYVSAETNKSAYKTAYLALQPHLNETQQNSAGKTALELFEESRVIIHPYQDPSRLEPAPAPKKQRRRSSSSSKKKSRSPTIIKYSFKSNSTPPNRAESITFDDPSETAPAVSPTPRIRRGWGSISRGAVTDASSSYRSSDPSKFSSNRLSTNSSGLFSSTQRKSNSPAYFSLPPSNDLSNDQQETGDKDQQSLDDTQW